MKKICERCRQEYEKEEADRRNLTDLYLNSLSVDLCTKCDRELLDWLHFDDFKLSDYDIIRRNKA